MGKRELVALLDLSSWCLVMVEQLFLTVPQGCLRFVIVVFPDHTYLLFFIGYMPCLTHCKGGAEDAKTNFLANPNNFGTKILSPSNLENAYQHLMFPFTNKKVTGV